MKAEYDKSQQCSLWLEPFTKCLVLPTPVLGRRGHCHHQLAENNRRNWERQRETGLSSRGPGLWYLTKHKTEADEVQGGLLLPEPTLWNGVRPGQTANLMGPGTSSLRV